MRKKSFLKSVLGILVVLISLISCDKDFNTIGSSIIGDPHFGYDLYTDATVNAFNMATGAVQSNNLPINSLGIYNNPLFGKTKAGFVTQLEMSSVNPDFKSDGLFISLDSVVASVPYFSKINTETSAYELDSIVGSGPINLKLFESGYFMADYDPNSNFQDQQKFYNDQESDFDGKKKGLVLNNSLDEKESVKFEPSNKEYITFKRNDDLTFKEKTTANIESRKSPRMSLHLDKAYFNNKIINAPEGSLLNNNVFKNYFRGLYFQVADADSGQLMRLDFTKGDITLYYRAYNDATKKKEVIKTFVLKMQGNTVNFLQQTNSAEYAGIIGQRPLQPIPNDSRLFVKGGEGSVAVIDLFGPNDTYGYSVRKINGTPVDEFGVKIPLDASGNPVTGKFIYEKQTAANGVPDELDDIRYPKSPVTGDGLAEYYSDKYQWLINEANLTFHIDTDEMGNTPAPLRLFLYDMNNRRPIYDYTTDVTTSATPVFNKSVLGGFFEVIEKNKKEYKVYKIKVTNHIRNVVKYADSTNVRLGLVVTESIGIVGNSKLKQSVDIPYFIKSKNARPFDRVPSASVIHPLGTVLYGSTDQGSDEENKKRLKLEIYYTKPN